MAVGQIKHLTSNIGYLTFTDLTESAGSVSVKKENRTSYVEIYCPFEMPDLCSNA